MKAPLTWGSALDPVLATIETLKVPYRSKPVEVQVDIARHNQTIVTLEGPVACKAGDAILTGIAGERWSVPAAELNQRYLCLSPATQVTPGRYQKRVKIVEAVQLRAPLALTLSEGRGVLRGQAGDWCVWHGPDDLSIVGRSVFAETYELLFIPVWVGLQRDVSLSTLESGLQALRERLPHTPIVAVREHEPTFDAQSFWWRVAMPSAAGESTVELNAPTLVLTPEQLLVPEGLLAALASSVSDSAVAYTRRVLWNLLPGAVGEAAEPDAVQVLARQLAALDHFNAHLAETSTEQGWPLIPERTELPEPAGLDRIHAIGTVADGLAGIYQTRWQKLVLATTNELAGSDSKSPAPNPMRLLAFVTRPTLIVLGLIAALCLAAFTELSDGCRPDDALAFFGCANPVWEHWFGIVSLTLYLVALAWAWCRYAHAKAEKWESRHQDFRLLAECLRVTYVRALLGKHDEVADDLPFTEPTESAWVRLALRALTQAQPVEAPSQGATPSALCAATQRCFVNHQLIYHRENLLARRERAIQLLSKSSRWALRLFAGMVVLQVVDVTLRAFWKHSVLSPMAHHFAVIFLVLGLAAWGACRKVLDTLGLEQEFQRGQRVLVALQLAEQNPGPESALQAAAAFLDDQAGWHALHRSKPVEASAGG